MRNSVYNLRDHLFFVLTSLQQCCCISGLINYLDEPIVIIRIFNSNEF